RTGRLIVDANGPLFVDRHGGCSFVGLLRKQARRRGRRRCRRCRLQNFAPDRTLHGLSLGFRWSMHLKGRNRPSFLCMLGYPSKVLRKLLPVCSFCLAHFIIMSFCWL